MGMIEIRVGEGLILEGYLETCTKRELDYPGWIRDRPSDDQVSCFVLIDVAKCIVWDCVPQ